MRIEPMAIADVLLITLERFEDARGWFVERYHKQKWAQQGFTENFVQDNHSRSKPHVLRGIHLQHNPAQGKLVGVTRGRIYDVAVDLRLNSPSFGTHVGAELSDVNNKLLWIPEGFGHGFCVLGEEEADVTYKVSGLYNPKGETGVRFDDAALAIAWPVKTPIISERDAVLGSLQDYIEQQKAIL
jgi:dTDP-4-dehydrorhamnose 3,5-epimerase